MYVAPFAGDPRPLRAKSSSCDPSQPQVAPTPPQIRGHRLALSSRRWSANPPKTASRETLSDGARRYAVQDDGWHLDVASSHPPLVPACRSFLPGSPASRRARSRAFSPSMPTRHYFDAIMMSDSVMTVFDAIKSVKHSHRAENHPMTLRLMKSWSLVLACDTNASPIPGSLADDVLLTPPDHLS